jgi:hypothetical protein
MYCKHAFLNCMYDYNDYSQPLILEEDFMNYLNLSKRLFPLHWDFLCCCRGINQWDGDNLQDFKGCQVFLILLNSLSAIRLRREQKLPPRRIPMVGIAKKVPSTTNTIIHKHHQHCRDVRPSYGMESMDLPDLMQVTSSKGVDQGRCCGILYKSTN